MVGGRAVVEVAAEANHRPGNFAMQRAVRNTSSSMSGHSWRIFRFHEGSVRARDDALHAIFCQNFPPPSWWCWPARGAITCSGHFSLTIAGIRPASAMINASAVAVDHGLDVAQVGAILSLCAIRLLVTKNFLPRAWASSMPPLDLSRRNSLLRARSCCSALAGVHRVGAQSRRRRASCRASQRAGRSSGALRVWSPGVANLKSVGVRSARHR